MCKSKVIRRFRCDLPSYDLVYPVQHLSIMLNYISQDIWETQHIVLSTIKKHYL